MKLQLRLLLAPFVKLGLFLIFLNPNDWLQLQNDRLKQTQTKVAANPFSGEEQRKPFEFNPSVTSTLFGSTDSSVSTAPKSSLFSFPATKPEKSKDEKGKDGTRSFTSTGTDPIIPPKSSSAVTSTVSMKSPSNQPSTMNSAPKAPPSSSSSSPSSSHSSSPSSSHSSSSPSSSHFSSSSSSAVTHNRKPRRKPNTKRKKKMKKKKKKRPRLLRVRRPVRTFRPLRRNRKNDNKRPISIRRTRN